VTLAERFWSKVDVVDDPESCWLWTGALTKGGYVKISEGPRGGRFLSAHRVAVELTGREIPPGKIVMHTCDTRACVRHTHLVVGTTSENLRDCIAKGRWGTGRVLRGTQQGTSKLDDEKVREIRRRAAAGSSLLSLAQEYHVSWPTIKDAVSRKTWRHVA